MNGPLANRVRARRQPADQADAPALPLPFGRSRRRAETLVIQHRGRFVRDPLAAWLLGPGDEPHRSMSTAADGPRDVPGAAPATHR